MVFGLQLSGSRISKRIRTAYLRALLRQNVGFFDKTGAGEVATRITADMNLVQDGISQKVGLTLAGIAGFIAALVVALVVNWRLALVLLCQPICIVSAMVVIGSNMGKAQGAALAGYASAANFAEEVISSIRNVAAHGIQPRFLARYEERIEQPAAHDLRAKMLLGAFFSCLMFINLSCYALAFWQGHRFLEAGQSTIGGILTANFAMTFAGFQLGQVAPHAQAFAAAGAAAKRIFATLRRNPPIDMDAGETPATVGGHVEFRGVKLVYPSRRTQLVLRDFDLVVPAGKTTAVVGPSGSGKSTLIALLERFYSPLAGQIFLDGKDIASLNLRWLRSKMSLVSQEPFLFNTTVSENIAYGLVGTEHENVSTAKKTPCTSFRGEGP